MIRYYRISSEHGGSYAFKSETRKGIKEHIETETAFIFESGFKYGLTERGKISLASKAYQGKPAKLPYSDNVRESGYPYSLKIEPISKADFMRERIE